MVANGRGSPSTDDMNEGRAGALWIILFILSCQEGDACQRRVTHSSLLILPRRGLCISIPCFF